LQVLAHEAVGHYGMEAITGPQVWAQITDTVGKMRQNPKHAALFAELNRRYGAMPSTDSVFVREAVAVMAEKGVRNSVIDRLFVAFRALLRRLGFTQAVAEAELRQQIVRAARRVEQGGRAASDQAILDSSPGSYRGFLGSSPAFRVPDDTTQEIGVGYRHGEEAITSRLVQWAASLHIRGSGSRPVGTSPKSVEAVHRNAAGAAEQGDATREAIREQSAS